MSSALATDVRWLFNAMLANVQMSNHRTGPDGSDISLLVLTKKDYSYLAYNNVICATYDMLAKSVTVHAGTPDDIRCELYKCLKQDFVHIGTSTDCSELYFVHKLAVKLDESHAILEALL